MSCWLEIGDKKVEPLSDEEILCVSLICELFCYASWYSNESWSCDSFFVMQDIDLSRKV